MMINDWNYFMNATNDSSYHHDQMSQYYQMVENFTSNRPESIGKHHGRQGPLQITYMYSEQFATHWKNVAKELNETFTDDLSKLLLSLMAYVVGVPMHIYDQHCKTILI
jgi:hypothetical protein